jgi:purine-binding chemotaxis protein CheW
MLVGDERYALPVENVEQIGELGNVAPVPGAGRAVIGVRNLDGRILPVFDLTSVLGIDGDAPSQLVVASLGDVSAGLAVSGVSGVGELDAPSDSASSELLAGTVLTNDALVGVLDVQRLFAALERHAAS